MAECNTYNRVQEAIRQHMRSIADAQGIAIAGGNASHVVDSMAHNGTKEQEALHIRALVNKRDGRMQRTQ